MLWSVLRLIFKTSSVTPDFFYVFNLILSFSTGSQSFKKICAWEVFGLIVAKSGKCQRRSQGYFPGKRPWERGWTNAPPCGAGNSRKCPTPGSTEDVPDEFVVE